jgi:DNA mismatch endonuclease (patch repair protein)
MADVLTPEQRKLNMSRIRSGNTTPELTIRKLLYARGIRGYRIHYNLPGKPDIVFVKRRLVIFIDGCFWHKCPLCYKQPHTREEFWIKKINKNVDRDQIVNEQLMKDGWTVLRFWEHEVRKCPDSVINTIINNLKIN